MSKILYAVRCFLDLVLLLFYMTVILLKFIFVSRIGVYMKKAFLLAIATVAAFSTQVQAADIEAGKAKAATCAACHGANGISAIPTYPNLAGQKPAYIVQQLKAFKSGERNNAIMKPMATMLTEADMINVAAYYASLK